MDKRNAYLMILGILAIFTLPYLVMSGSELHVDEKAHHEYITGFVEGNYTPNPDLPTLPGYHVLLTVVAKATGSTSPWLFRLVSVIISLMTIMVFFLLLRQQKDKYINPKLLMFVFLPVLFPFFFLIYTDVLSLLFVLIALLFLRRGRIGWSTIFSVLAILVRQNNIMWVGFFLVYLYVDGNGYSFRTEQVRGWLQKAWPYIIVIAGFMVFFILNGGAAIGDMDAHPSDGIHFGNILFALFLIFPLFLPLHMTNLRRIRDLLGSKTVWLILALGYAVFLLVFENTHPYNVDWAGFFPRNWILITFTSSILMKTLFFLPVGFSALSLWVTPLHRNIQRIIYPFAVLFLMPSWLVETRYLIIPVILFILFKKEESRKAAWVTVVWWGLLSALIFYGISRGWFFL